MKREKYGLRKILDDVDLNREQPLSPNQLDLMLEILQHERREATNKLDRHWEYLDCRARIIELMANARVNGQVEREINRQQMLRRQGITPSTDPAPDLFENELQVLSKIQFFEDQIAKNVDQLEWLQAQIDFNNKRIVELTGQINQGPLTEADLERAIDGALPSKTSPDRNNIDIEESLIEKVALREELTDLSRQRWDHELERIKWIKSAIESPAVAAQQALYEERHQRREAVAAQNRTVEALKNTIAGCKAQIAKYKAQLPH